MFYLAASVCALILTLLPVAPAAAQTCRGDCSANLVVTVDELIVCVNIALGTTDVGACRACDGDGDGVSISELVQAVGAALTGCPGAVQLPGSCRRPGANGTAPCAPGSRVIVFRCRERAACLSSASERERLGEGTVDASGRFHVLVDGRRLDGGLLLFEAEAGDATAYRALDLGSASSGARVGRGAGAMTTVIDPSSEATVRLIDEIGMENFSDAGVLEIDAAVRVATAAMDFSGLSAAEAATLATQTARADPQVQIVLRRNATPTATVTASRTATPTSTATASPTEGRPSPTATPTATATASPTETVPPLFGPAQVLPAGDRPSAVAVADLNRDQVPDIVAANANSFDVSVWLGLPAGGFAARRDFPVGEGTFPAALVVADLNGDGVPDLATADSFTDQVSVLLGDGDGGFGPPERLEVGVTPSAIAAGLLDADDRIDLVTANRSFESISVLLGGEGGFAPQELFTVGVGPTALVLVDLDGDQQLDAVTANVDSSDISVLRGLGNGAFATQMRFAVGAGPAAVAVADVNGDLVGDLATAHADADEVAVSIRTENAIAFPAPARYATGDNPLALAIADVNGDGAADLITANALSADISVLLGDGDGGFAPERRTAVGDQPVALAVADLDGDGALDVLTADSHADALTLLPGLPRQ